MEISNIVRVNGERGCIRDIDGEGSMIMVEMTEDGTEIWFYFDDREECWREDRSREEVNITI
jgi:hypothetical protein